MKVRGNVKARGMGANHNHTLVGGLKVRTKVKAGRLAANHNETLILQR
jgi:hypothetical protein